MLLHPLRKKRRFSGPLFVPKITGMNFLPTVSPALAVKTMSGSFGCGGTRWTLHPRLRSFSQSAPLRLDERVSAPRARLIQGLISYSMP
jgi:hypothetical protein